jgi:hypothetical protein
VFLGLPPLDLDDGRSLRRAAFDVWSASVRESAAHGGVFETTFRASRPLVTGLTMLGASVVASSSFLVLWRWSTPARGPVTVEPSTVESVGIVLAVSTIFALVTLSAAAFARAWLCRGGSYVKLSTAGVTVRKDGRPEPCGVLSGATFHPLVRCTRLDFADGRPSLWVPAEHGALRRVDLLAAALDDRLGAALRKGL